MSELKGAEQKGWFKPTLSFDGLVFLIAILGAAVLYGRQEQKVEDHTITLSQHETEIRQLNNTTATLTAIINEREKQAR